MIIKFVLNAILHHVGMSWIICYKNEMFYETEENNHTNWFNTGTWYNAAICSKLRGRLFEYFIKHARTDICPLMCYIIAHCNQQP